jgi:hypothetical protein
MSLHFCLDAHYPQGRLDWALLSLVGSFPEEKRNQNNGKYIALVNIRSELDYTSFTPEIRRVKTQWLLDDSSFIWVLPMDMQMKKNEKTFLLKQNEFIIHLGKKNIKPSPFWHNTV